MEPKPQRRNGTPPQMGNVDRHKSATCHKK